MKLCIFSIYDVKASCYALPFFMAAPAQAIRAFGDACSDKNSMLCKHPEDYRLFQLGEFDDNSGKFTSLNIVELLACGNDFNKKGVSDENKDK